MAYDQVTIESNGRTVILNVEQDRTDADVFVIHPGVHDEPWHYGVMPIVKAIRKYTFVTNAEESALLILDVIARGRIEREQTACPG